RPAAITVVSPINGANQYFATRVFRLGADVFGLSKTPSIITNVQDWLEFQKRKRLTYDDFEAVRDLCKTCQEVGASLGGRLEAKSGLNSSRTPTSAPGLRKCPTSTMSISSPAGTSPTPTCTPPLPSASSATISSKIF